MREGSRAQKPARPTARRDPVGAAVLLTLSRMKLQRGLLPGIIDISPAARSAGLRHAVHRFPAYVAARDMNRPSVTALPEDPRT
jgi:hypothetical protein